MSGSCPDSPARVSAIARRRGSESRGAHWLRGLLAPLAALLLRGLGASWRVRVRHGAPLPGPPAPELLAYWHQDVLLAAVVWRDSGAVAPVSQSRDGEYIAAIMPYLGLADPPRGSSSRGGAQALRGLVKQARAGAFVAVMVDGPHGPAHRAKPGILATARLSQRAIRPVAMRARPRLRFRSWDRTQLALPFARVEIAAGAPLAVPRTLTPEQQAALLRELAARIDALHAELESIPRAGRRRTTAPRSA